MTTAVTTYLVYLLVSLALTLWIGRTLHSNGAVFLIDVFKGNAELARAVNHLLVVGFYLINFGFVSLTLRMTNPPHTAQASIESLSIKLGGVMLVLGVLHLANVFVFNRMRINAGQATRPRTGWQPVAPPTTQPAHPQ